MDRIHNYYSKLRTPCGGKISEANSRVSNFLEFLHTLDRSTDNSRMQQTQRSKYLEIWIMGYETFSVSICGGYLVVVHRCTCQSPHSCNMQSILPFILATLPTGTPNIIKVGGGKFRSQMHGWAPHFLRYPQSLEWPIRQLSALVYLRLCLQTTTLWFCKRDEECM